MNMASSLTVNVRTTIVYIFNIIQYILRNFGGEVANIQRADGTRSLMQGRQELDLYWDHYVRILTVAQSSFNPALCFQNSTSLILQL